MQTRTANRTRRIMDADAVIDKRVERLSRRPLHDVRADLGVVHCAGCDQDTLPLKSGRCAWCDRQIVQEAA